MKLCLDLQATQSESAERGVGRYSRGLAEGIVRSGRAEVTFLLNTALLGRYEAARDWLRALSPESGLLSFCGPTGIMGLYSSQGLNWAGASALYDSFLRHNGINSLHTSAPFDGMGDDTVIGDPRSRSGAGIFRMGTIYDLIPFEEPEHYLADPRYRKWFNARLDILKSYDLLLAISDYTRDVAIEFGGMHPDRVVAISTDTTEAFRPIHISENDRQPLLKKYGIFKPFAMHTGVLEGRKNVKTLIAAFAALPPHLIATHQLVLVTKVTESQKADMVRTAAQFGLPADTLVFPGFVSDADLAKLYNMTRVLVMPSTSEGFGLPLLEAMRCGAPVLGADATSIPEVVGHKDYLFNPYSPSDLAQKLNLILDDAGFAKAARAHSQKQQAAFSWDRSAGIMLDAFESKQRGRSLRPTQPKISYNLLGKTTESHGAALLGKYEFDAALEKRNSRPAVASLPILLTDDTSLSREQEAALLTRPYAVIAGDTDASLKCSPEVKYVVEGYSALLPVRHDRIYEIQTERLADRAQCYHFAPAGVEMSRVIEAGDNACRDLCEFIANVPSGLDHGAAAQLSWLAHINLLPTNPECTLYIDISELVNRDARTGIQRVVRSVLYHCLSQPQGFRVEPVYRDGGHYRLARAFCVKFMGLPKLHLDDSYVTFNPGDIFLGLDLDALILPEALLRLRRERLRGVRIAWIIYDILAVAHPEWFDKPMAAAIQTWIDRISLEADHMICISRAVADTVIENLNETNPRRNHPLDVSWWHLGSDLDGSAPSQGISSAEEVQLKALPDGVPMFLTVGTIEPRKGIAKLLAGAEAFWADGGEGVFVLVGKAGWNVAPLIERLRSHPELNKRLFWFEGISDELLNLLYARADAALLPSEGEGFGLPLAEAGFHKKPVIARDLTVFREIAHEYAYYFRGETPEEFAEELQGWLTLYAVNKHPLPKFSLQTWQQSTNSLLKTIFERNGETRTWHFRE